MPRRSKRRLLAQVKNKNNITTKNFEDDVLDKEMNSARGRLMGALKEVGETGGDESDEPSTERSPSKQERYNDRCRRYSSSEDEDVNKRQSYVLKLFDRSVDLSQFHEDSPLYPICRAWIVNQPKANYKKMAKKSLPLEWNDDSMILPGPEGPQLSRIPELLPEQKAHSKDNINLNYREAPPPSKQQLLASHAVRWSKVRRAWIQQAAKVEDRYAATQEVLNSFNNGL